MPVTIDIDGNGLSIAELVQIGYYKAQVVVTDEAWTAVKEGRKVVDDILLIKTTPKPTLTFNLAHTYT